MDNEVMGWVGVIIVLLTIGIIIGWLAGSASLSDNCDHLGKFRFGTTTYECHPEGKRGVE